MVGYGILYINKVSILSVARDGEDVGKSNHGSLEPNTSHLDHHNPT
jgi:hypothetical protein